MKKIKNKELKSEDYAIENSPFVERTRVRTRFNLQEIQNSSSDIVLARKRAFQSDEYIKFILSNELNLAAYYRMSKLAMTLLQYIVQNCLEYNTPVFTLDIKDFMILIKFKTDNKVYEAIKELIDNEYIARTHTNKVYWINHNIYYKGNFLITRQIKIAKEEEYKQLGIKIDKKK